MNRIFSSVINGIIVAIVLIFAYEVVQGVSPKPLPQFREEVYTPGGGPLLISIFPSQDSIYVSTDTDYIFAYPATTAGFTDVLKLISILSFPTLDDYEFEYRVKALHDMHYHTRIYHR